MNISHKEYIELLSQSRLTRKQFDAFLAKEGKTYKLNSLSAYDRRVLEGNRGTRKDFSLEQRKEQAFSIKDFRDHFQKQLDEKAYKDHMHTYEDIDGLTEELFAMKSRMSSFTSSTTEAQKKNYGTLTDLVSKQLSTIKGVVDGKANMEHTHTMSSIKGLDQFVTSIKTEIKTSTDAIQKDLSKRAMVDHKHVPGDIEGLNKLLENLEKKIPEIVETDLTRYASKKWVKKLFDKYKWGGTGGGSGGSGGGGTWGTITGTLSNQTDLQTALNLKATITGTPAATQVAVFDSVGSIVGSPYFTFTDFGSGSNKSIIIGQEDVVTTIDGPAGSSGSKDGGSIWIRGGLGSSVSGDGGGLQFSGGNTTASGRFGGSVNIFGGTSTSGTAGGFSLLAGSSTNGNGGNTTLSAGSGSVTTGTGGNMTITAGNGLTKGTFNLRQRAGLYNFASDGTSTATKQAIFDVSAVTSSAKTFTFPNITGTVALLEGNQTFTLDISVPAEVYGSGWDGSNEVPTKNDIYDKIQAVIAGATAGGSDTQIQFNDGGAFGGDADFTWNKTTNKMTIGAIGGTGTINGASDSVGSGVGTNLAITSGYGGATGGAGGNVTITASAAQAGNSDGGTVNISAGEASGSGTNGLVFLSDGSGNSQIYLEQTGPRFINQSAGTYRFYSAAGAWNGIFDFFSLSTNRTYTWPNKSGTVAMTSDITGAVAGSDKQVQFNDGGVFGADVGFEYDKTTNALTVDNGSVRTIEIYGLNDLIMYDSTSDDSHVYLIGGINARVQMYSDTGNYEFGHGNNSDYGTFAFSGITTSRTYTLPDDDMTVVGHDTAQTLTNKTLGDHLILAENAAVLLDPALSADGKYNGTVRAGTAGTTLAFGDLVYLDPTDSRRELADANSAQGADGDARGMLGICVLAAAADGDPTIVLLRGFVRADAAFPAMTVNNQMYVSETAGDITGTQPTTTDAVIRVVGVATTADELYFNPSMDYITHI